MSGPALAFRALRFRAVQSILLALLAAGAVAACAVGPMYERAVEQAAFQSSLRTAPQQDRGISIAARSAQEAQGYLPTGAAARLFDAPVSSQQVSLVFPTLLDKHFSGFTGTAVNRTDACAHLTIVSGHCASGPTEVVMAEETIRAFALHVGDSVPASAIGGTGQYRLHALKIAGAYRVSHPDDAYWFNATYATPAGFTPIAVDDAPDIAKLDPVFVGTAAIDAFGRAYTKQVGGRPNFLTEVQLRMIPGSLRLNDLGPLRATVADIQRKIAAAHPVGDPARATLTTRLPQLLDTVDQGRRQTRVIVPTLIAQLAIVVIVLLGMVIAVGVDQRRTELALARLRGRSRSEAARFVAGEVGVVVVLTFVPGMVLAWLTCRLLIATALPDYGIVPEWRWPVLAAGAAVAGLTVLIANVIARRAATQPIQDLLRSVAPRRSKRGLGVFEAAIAVAAIGGVVVALTGGRKSALALIAPALLAVLAGVVLSRVIVVVARVFGARAMWRSRVGAAIAALHVARSQNFRRVVILVCVAAALAVSAVDQWSVTRTARAARADVQIGAPVVLSVNAASGTDLVNATAKADPAGSYAMPVIVEPATSDTPPLMAVTRTGLRHIALWGSASDRPGQKTVDSLAPSHPPPAIKVQGSQLELRLKSVRVTASRGVEPRPKPVSLQLAFRLPDASLTDAIVALPNSTSPVTVRAPLVECARGCRLSRIQILRAPGDFSPAHIAIAFQSLSVDGTAADLGRADDWGNVNAVQTAAGQAGSIAFSEPDVGLVLSSDNDGTAPVILQYLDLPVELPCLVAGGLDINNIGENGLSVDGVDSSAITCAPAGSVPFAPRVGARAVIVDINLAIALSTNDLLKTSAMIFLGKDDPVRERTLRTDLAQVGITVTDRQTAAAQLRQYDDSPPAWAIQVALIAACAAAVVAALMIVIVAFTSRSVRRPDLAALRLVGVPARTVRRAVLAEQLMAVLLGAVVGSAVGAVGARLALPAVPLFLTAAAAPKPVLTTAWPQSLIAAIATLLLLLAGAAAASWVLGRNLSPARAGEAAR